MPDRKLDIAFWNYDRTRLLADRTVKIEGVDAAFHSARIVAEIFKAMIQDRAYDVSELGMTYFLRLFSDDDPPFLALPVFLVRCFRHSAIYINKKKGIRRPQDLTGKRIGELGLYDHDAGVMPKGVLSDEYGTPDQCRWIVGRIDFPMEPVDFVPRASGQCRGGVGGRGRRPWRDARARRDRRADLRRRAAMRARRLA
jgi:4,5-dihydroxyphthalate decarboxylase